MDTVPMSSFTRSRWAALGAAVAISLGAGGLMTASADISSGERGVFVPITPCRIADTRPAPDNVGARNGTLGPQETYTFLVRGTNGNCTIPADAVGVVMNIAAVVPTANSFFTLFPADAPRPLTANLNFVGGQAPVSNAVTVRLSTSGSVPGQVSIFNLAGTTHFTADIVGYFVGHNHDDRYYTKTELDTRQWGSSNIADYRASNGLSNEDVGVLFAAVDAALPPSVLRSSPTATVARISPGRYAVSFGRNITTCAYTATIGDLATGVEGPGQIDVAPRNGDVNAVFVRTTDNNLTDTDLDFYLMVVC